jgi:hypothetical protein
MVRVYLGQKVYLGFTDPEHKILIQKADHHDTLFRTHTQVGHMGQIPGLAKGKAGLVPVAAHQKKYQKDKGEDNEQGGSGLHAHQPHAHGGSHAGSVIQVS